MGIVTAEPSPTNAPRQLSDGNGDGTLLGQSPTDLIGFYGETPASPLPIVQPSGPGQAALTRGQAGGVISTYGTSQSPAAVAPNTSAEVGLTVQSGTVTNTRILITTGDLLYINKPTSQAGLGVGNIRVSASNVAGVTFSNATAATVTPTSTQTYGIVAIRGLPTLSATLSPAAVQPNSVTEQQFSVPGAVLGRLIQVSKPTAQAGIDIVGVRTVSDNLVGVTFANFTAATVTPTASESYTFNTLNGVDAMNNNMVLSYNAGTIGAIGAGLVVTGAPITFTGALATDIPIGPPVPPSAQAATTNASAPIYQVITANTLTAYFLSAGTGFTPTANLTYDQVIYRLAPAGPLVNYSQSLAPVSVAANTTAEQTFTVTGLVASSPVWVNKPSWTNGLGIVGVRVSALNTLAINYLNNTAAAIVPPTETYVIGNFQVPIPGAGNVASQSVVPAITQNTVLTQNTRGALVNLGLMAGA